MFYCELSNQSNGGDNMSAMEVGNEMRKQLEIGEVTETQAVFVMVSHGWSLRRAMSFLA